MNLYLVQRNVDRLRGVYFMAAVVAALDAPEADALTREYAGIGDMAGVPLTVQYLGPYRADQPLRPVGKTQLNTSSVLLARWGED